MGTISKVFSLLPLAAIAALAQTARADSSGATCRFYKNGDKVQSASGPCTFSQRQGYIDINLHSGDTVSLSPRDKADHFKDKKGNKVVRTGTYGSTQVFKWDDKDKKLIVNFSDTTTTHQDRHSSDQPGETPRNLSDLVGAHGGQAEGALEARGYEYRNGSKSGDSSYTNWQERSTGRCVTIRTLDGRYHSIVYAPDLDCQQGNQHAADGHGDADSFKTVCGVMVGGENHRYRCTVEDHYQGDRKTSTTLRFPDQTLNMIWKPGRHVELQFEGMVPMSARYTTSEGETNFVFEDKTYFYYSDKEVARREVKHFQD